MKNERPYPSCQYGGGSGQQDTRLRHRNSRSPLSLSPSLALTTTVSVVTMGLQPLTRATSRLPHLASCSPSAMDQQCQCPCTHKPQDRTILHGILTGQGYKFGYGNSFGSALFRDSSGYSDNGDICLDMEALEEPALVPSREATSPSRFITPPVGK